MPTLTRRKSGFITYPQSAEKRIVDGTARFRTKCDMLIGPCACGGVHQEDDDWVQRLLEEYSYNLEINVLHPEPDGYTVLIPRYWTRSQIRQNCNVLQGVCLCGKVHLINEQWVLDLLNLHRTTVEDCPEIHESAIGKSDPINEVIDDGFEDCNCDHCCRQRQNSRSLLNRRDI